MGIPKIVHYCWFGKESIPEKEKKCISTWWSAFSGYDFKLWTEENFEINNCTFARQAYDNKRFAFVSDYARAKVLYEYGGLYLDTDVKVLKGFIDLLDQYDGVIGFERKAFIGTALIACQPHDPCIRELLEYYETHDFQQKDGGFDNIANVSIITDIMKSRGLVLGGERQSIPGFEIFNREYFYPKKISETDFRIVDETVAIHMCSNSWLSDRERKRGNNKIWIEVVRPVLRGMRALGIKTLGNERIRSLEIKLRNKLR